MNQSTTRTPLESKAFTVTTGLGALKWDMKAIPDRDGSGVHYIDRIELNVTISAITQGGGGACSPLAMHNAFSAWTVKANDGQPWGPSAVSSQTIDESRFLARGRALPYAKDILGDSNVAAGAGPTTRAFRIVFDFDAFGRPGTFTPPATYFKDRGAIYATLAVPTANTTAFTGTAQMVVYTHGEPKLRAIPRLTLTSQVLASKDYNLGGGGMLLQHFLESSAAIVAADITALNLKGSGGFTLLDTVDVLACRTEDYAQNPEVTAINLLRHWCDPVGGTNPLALPIFPPSPTYEGIMALPTSDNFTAKITGAPTIGNFSSCQVLADPLPQEDADKQLISMGGTRDASSKTQKDVPGGVVHNDRIAPFIPSVLVSTSAVK